MLVVGTALLMLGMSLAATPIGAQDETLAPSVTKEVSPDMIWFGSTTTKATVTIEVTGNGGTDTTITPIDVVFAIDSSGSMSWNDPSNDRLTAVNGFIDNLDDTRDQGGVVSWDTDVDFSEGLMTDFDDTDGLKYYVNQVDSSGGTNLNVGLAEAVAMLDANTRVGDSIEIIIFLTDGEGTYTYYGGGGPVDDAVDAGYIIYSIGLGSPASGPLEDMADNTGGVYYDSADASNLQDIYDTIFEEIVTSTVPHFVDVYEVLQDYLVLCTGTFNINPDSITYNLDGTTTIEWDNVAQYVGDYDDALNADETVTLTFMVKATKAGYQLPVQVLPDAHLTYDDSDGNYVGSVPIPQDYIDVGYSTELIAGGGNVNSEIDVGEVFIWQDEDNLYVKYVTEDGWYMTETHVHVAGDASDIPQTKNGNPQVGKFDYSMDHDPAVDEYMYTIPLDENWGDTFYVAAHAVVQKVIGYDDDGFPIYQVETAWGDGNDFPGNNWATYIEYVDP